MYAGEKMDLESRGGEGDDRNVQYIPLPSQEHEGQGGEGTGVYAHRG